MPRYLVSMTARAAGSIYVEADDEKHARDKAQARADDDGDDLDDAGWTPDDEIRIRSVTLRAPAPSGPETTGEA